MRFLEEYRDRPAAERLAEAIAREATRPWVIMEVCGGQTHSIVRHGLDELLPSNVELVHGPGCPVCVTSIELVDHAQALAMRPDTTLCSFGDMLRVPGTDGDLFTRRAQGADVRVVYSPLDALKLAERHPERQVVFFAIGFETTAPANAMAVWLAKRRGVANFSVLVSHVLVPPAITSILSAEDNRVQGFLGPGHVCAVMGLSEYEALASRHGVPIAISGFEPVDLLDGVLHTVRKLERGEAGVVNCYGRSVQKEGNLAAQNLMRDVFELCDRSWRGIGEIPSSGYRLRTEYAAYDASLRFAVSPSRSGSHAGESEECIAGQILRGVKKPCDCPAFGTRCTPDRPLGATMVSAEGACAAYFGYGRHLRVVGEELGP